MDKTILEIPTELLEAARITPEEAKKELAVRLYQTHKLNDKQAAELAGDSKAVEALVWNKAETGHFDLDDFLDWASHDLKTPLISPLYAELGELPPLLIQVGTEETLLDDSTRLAERAQAAGVEVTLEIWKGMIHVFQLYARFLPDARQAIEGIGVFMRQRIESEARSPSMENTW